MQRAEDSRAVRAGIKFALQATWVLQDPTPTVSQPPGEVPKPGPERHTAVPAPNLAFGLPGSRHHPAFLFLAMGTPGHLLSPARWRGRRLPTSGSLDGDAGTWRRWHRRTGRHHRIQGRTTAALGEQSPRSRHQDPAN